jgi:hypothetical protein
MKGSYPDQLTRWPNGFTVMGIGLITAFGTTVVESTAETCKTDKTEEGDAILNCCVLLIVHGWANGDYLKLRYNKNILRIVLSLQLLRVLTIDEFFVLIVIDVTKND